ncbi:MAG: FAD-dependent oxidoreductase, partial [Desulfohalobiaceae bacterium]|nr:FAD-dependent oxidoreductase [Desulfohalobiaceae bacterium]
MTRQRVPSQELIPAPCQEACPAGVDAARYIRLIRQGKFDQALAVNREKIPFPLICGYACYSFCEKSCTARYFHSPIAIRALKRLAAEKGGDAWKKNLNIAPDSGKKAAIVGSGPSGLTAAYYLRCLGHAVTVFEALNQAGGMMRYGIPGYRLPAEALDKEINVIKDLDVDIRTSHRVESAEELLRKGFDAVYLAPGAQKGDRLNIPGEDCPGVVDSISFLRELNQERPVTCRGKVVVIGGGNTAMDAARSARRLGGEKVSILYRRGRAEMPADHEEIEAALEEGVTLECLTAPIGIETRNGRLQLTCTRMRLGEPDASGRRSPLPVSGSEYAIDANQVVAAIGQRPEGARSFGVGLNDREYVNADFEDLHTDLQGVFAGGDIVSGPASIIEAIGHGRKAAAAMDRFLGGSGDISQTLAPPETEIVLDDILEDKPREPLACLAPENRTTTFHPVELCMNVEVAVDEAKRCLECDARRFEVTLYPEYCKECSYCAEVCERDVFAPAQTFNPKGYRPMEVVHPERCVGCRACYYACP